MRFVLLICAGLLAASAASATSAITKTQSRAWPEEQVKSRVFEQAAAAETDKEKRVMMTAFRQIDAADGDAVAPMTALLSSDEMMALAARVRDKANLWHDPDALPHPRHALGQMSFEMTPRATALPGLCESDVLTFFFNAVGPDEGPDTRVRASNAMVDRRFAVLAPPEQVLPQKASAESRAVLEQRCAAQDRDTGFFYASNAWSALAVVALARRVVDGARKKAPPFDVDCGGVKDCIARIGAAKPEIGWGASCESGSVELTCRVPLAAGMMLTVATPRDAPDRILRVRYDEEVIIADAIAD